MGVWYTCKKCKKQFLIHHDDNDISHSDIFCDVTDEIIHLCDDCTFDMLDKVFGNDEKE